MIQLVFEESWECEQFQSSIRHLPLVYRKRKSEDSNNDISVIDKGIVCSMNNSQLTRVFEEDYYKIEGDVDPSEECDGLTIISSSYVSAVHVDELVKCQLLDKEVSIVMYGKKTEKCHLKSQSQFPNDKNNPNNILYMSRHLHEHFDGINTEEGVPSFNLTYVSHNPNPFNIIVGGKTIQVYETNIRVVFINESFKAVLAPLFRDYTSFSIYLHHLPFNILTL